MPNISFFVEDTEYIVNQKLFLKRWIKSVIEIENKKYGNINFIFCSDNYLINKNIQFLNHNTFTDIITFDYTEDYRGKISGDIFISIERVKENAENFNIPFVNELHRVMIHGILHLLGYKDKTKHQKALMRLKEDNCLSLQKK